MVLYFGCRRSDQDNLYKEEREQMEGEGVLTAQHLALSREPGLPKVLPTNSIHLWYMWYQLYIYLLINSQVLEETVYMLQAIYVIRHFT